MWTRNAGSVLLYFEFIVAGSTNIFSAACQTHVNTGDALFSLPKLTILTHF